MSLAPLTLALWSALAAPAAPEPEPSKLAVKTLDPVVVVASRSPEPQQQVVGAVSRLDRERMEQRGVHGMADLASQIPGMDVTADPNRFSAIGFNVRGLDGNRVSVELDGIPLADSFGVGQFALAGRDLVELGIVDRVEVLRGPASTLYGSKALAGVVAYWTPDPWEAFGQDQRGALTGQIRTGLSTRDDSYWLSGRMMSRSDDGRWSSLIALGRRQGHQADNTAERDADAANPADYRSDSLLLKTVLDAGPAGRWTASAEHGGGRRQTDVQSLLFGPGRFSTTYALAADDRYARDRMSLEAQWSRLGGLGPVHALLYHQRSVSEQFSDQYRLPDRATPFRSRRERWFEFDQASHGMKVTGQWRGSLAGMAHWQVFGLDLARHRYRGWRDGIETNLITGRQSRVILGERFPLRDFPTSNGTELGLFWQDEIRFAPAWALVPGLRWERYRLQAAPDAVWREDNPLVMPASLGNQSLTPKLGLRWGGPKLAAYLQYARGFRAPPFADVNIGLNLPAFNYVALPNPELKPERSRGLELGLRWNGPRVQGSLVLYDNRFRDLIDSRANLGSNDQGQLVFQSVNRARARIRGAELEFHAQLDGLGAPAQGWYLELLASSSRGKDEQSAQPLNSVVPDRATLTVGYLAADGRWGSEFRFTGVKRVSQANQLSGPLFLPPGYSRGDANVWLDVGERIRLNLSLFNLADRQYWDWSSLRGLPATADDIDFYSRPGRGLSLTARFEF